MRPVGSPHELIRRRRDERVRYIGLGAEPETSTPEQFAAYLKNDIGNWAKVVKASGAKAE